MTITNRLGLYIHIPFCKKKCAYCDFLSFEHKEEAERQAYVKALVKEIETQGKVYNKFFIVDTVFIGGGTPSLLCPGQISGILGAVKNSFNLLDNAEITMEANPGTVTEETLSAYLSCGVNRLSMGVQALSDQMLRGLGRIHGREEFLANYEAARRVGFRNINLDFMFAIPSHTQEIWEETVKQAIALKPEHISTYSLQLEEGTPFFEQFQQDKLQQIPDHIDRQMYHRAIKLLTEAGYSHYEISNFAKPGYQCRHNLKYWSMEAYLGLGLGAHSFMSCERRCNTSDFQKYLSWQEGNGPKPEVYANNTEKDCISEYLFTGLRRMEGISLSAFRRRFGKTLEEAYAGQNDVLAAIEAYRDGGYLIFEGDSMRLSLAGVDVSNGILTEFV